jgi:hypothetical protein
MYFGGMAGTRKSQVIKALMDFFIKTKEFKVRLFQLHSSKPDLKELTIVLLIRFLCFHAMICTKSVLNLLENILMGDDLYDVSRRVVSSSEENISMVPEHGV